MPSPKDTNGPIVKSGPTKGQNRSRNNSGEWRKKRDDTGVSRGKKKGACFITTVVCDSRGMQDDCHELKTLRLFRDQYLLSSPEGEALVNEYYRIAPDIAKKLTRADDLQYAWDSINICLSLIELNAYNETVEQYKKMVTELSNRVKV